MISPNVKVHKLIADAGFCSRRKAEQWIREGAVRVNGKVVSIGDRALSTDRIEINGQRLSSKLAKTSTRVLVYHKPEGEVVSRDDPSHKRSVFDRLPALSAGRWIAVGRLDINTTGLLLFTNDGALANRLMHPSSGIDREYLVRVMGHVDQTILNRLREGVLIDQHMARFTDIVEAPNKTNDASINRWFYVCLSEGRNREVRKLWESQGLRVNRLKRVRFGPMFLPARIRQGHWEELTAKDIKALESSIQA